MEVLSGASWPTLVLTAILGVLILVKLWTERKLPPGPVGIPIVGYMPFLGSKPHQTLAQLAKKYGDVMSLNIVGRTFIHLNSYAAMKEAYAQRDDMAGRSREFCLLTWLDNGLGIAQAEGPPWKEHRRFLLSKLRNLGYGKRTMEDRVKEISNDMIEEFRTTGSKPHDPIAVIANCTANSICSLVLSKRYHQEDPEFIRLVKASQVLIEHFLGLKGILTGPFMKLIFPFLPGYKELRRSRDEVMSVIRKHILEHEKTFDPNNIRDYVDAFIHEMKHSEKGEKSTFTIDRAAAIVMNLFLGGTESVSSSVYLSFLVMMVHQDVQKRVQQELDEVVGRERLPSLDDRASLPYTDAVISELQRYVIIFPIVPSHSNPDETPLHCYTIPKRAETIGNIWAVNRDLRVWRDPGKFDPGRFLDSSGKIQNKEKLILYSIGKRICPGESHANLQWFIYFTAILQNFSLQFPAGEAIGESELLRLLDGNRTEISYRMCAVPRQ